MKDEWGFGSRILKDVLPFRRNRNRIGKNTEEGKCRTYGEEGVCDM